MVKLDSSWIFQMPYLGASESKCVNISYSIKQCTFHNNNHLHVDNTYFSLPVMDTIHLMGSKIYY